MRLELKKIGIVMAILAAIFAMNTVVFAATKTSSSGMGTVSVDASLNGYNVSEDSVKKTRSASNAIITDIEGVSTAYSYYFKIYVHKKGSDSTYCTGVQYVNKENMTLSLTYEDDCPTGYYYTVSAQMYGYPMATSTVTFTMTLVP